MAPTINSTSGFTRISVQNNVFEFTPPPLHDDSSGFESDWLGCVHWLPIQKSALFQLANVCFFLGFTSPTGAYGSLFLHSCIVLGYLLYATWAWNVVCAPSIFTWASAFVILNVGQILNTLYQMRTVRFLPDLEAVYVKVFKPFRITRKEFRLMTSSDYAHLVTLIGGDAYAVEKVTKTDRLAVLVKGRMQVSFGNRPLHCVFAHEFVDSAEFHSSASLRAHNRFTVSITASTECELLIWERADLEYLMVKYPHVRTIMDSLVAKDILLKLSILGSQIPGWRGQQPCDLRLAQRKSFVQALRARSITGSLLLSPPSHHQDDADSIRSSDASDIFSLSSATAAAISPLGEIGPPPQCKSPLSMPYSANIDLAQWYHAFLKRELIYERVPAGGASRQNSM